MTKNLVILNDPPYGTERSYNGLRLAGALAKQEGHQVRVFLMGDAAGCAKAGQQTPNGYYNLERMLRAVTNRQGEIAVCGTCMDARGIASDELAEGAVRSTLDQLAESTSWADRILVFRGDPSVRGPGSPAPLGSPGVKYRRSEKRMYRSIKILKIS
jgi:uncharacterized protein involved in oxidation of intracellular sulfur